MTTIHQIGELLRSGVRPTDEETEDLKSLGGFVAEMYGRFMGGHAEHLSSAADLWSGRLAGRLSAATGARWEKGLGLAELLLGSELTSFWQIAREGLSAGYDGLDLAEMGMVDLYEEDAPEPVAAAEEGAPQRRRGSLFGARGKAPSVVRKALRQAAVRRPEGRQQLTTVDLESEAGAGVERDVGQPQRETRWRDGSRAEMSVIRALAAGGLFVGDQVVDVAPRGAAQVVRGVGATAQAAPRANEIGAAGLRAGGLKPVFLDGVRIDGRTPALASALARVDAVFGRGAKAATDGASAAAVSQSRMGRLTATADYSIDRGFGTGERPVYGFYDAAETTYLNLQNEVAAVAATAPEADVQVPRAMRSRAVRTMPASVQGLRQMESTRTQVAARAPVTAVAARPQGMQAGLAAGANVHVVSLEQVVDARGGALKPFVGGVFANRANEAAAPVARKAESIALAGQISHTPAGEPTVRVHRGGMSAPRYSVLEASQVAPAVARFYDVADAGTMSFVAGAAPVMANVARGAEVVRATEAAQVAAGATSSGVPVVGTVQGSNQLVGAQTVSRAGMPTSAVEAMSPVARVLGRGREIGGGFSLAAGASVGAEQGAAVTGMGALGPGASSAGWRLAIDGGADLPLGATFSRYEAFAGGRVSQAAADMRATRSEFRPVIAGGADTERPSELAQAVDGLVWVTLPNEAAAVQAPSTDEMGLAAVPSRRAAMVPAGLAFQSIAGVVAGARRAVAAVGAGPMAVAQAGRGLVVGPRGELLAAGEVAGGSQGAFAGAASRALVGGQVASAGGGVQARTFGAQQVESGEQQLAAATVGGVAARSLSGATYDGVAFAQALRSGFLGNVVASGARAAQLGSVQSPALAAVAARGEVGEGSMGGRWVEAALRGNALERGLRAARFLDGMVGEGNYGRIESERQLLAMVREPVVAEPVASQEMGADAPRAGRLAARRLAPVAVGRGGGVQSMLGRVEMKPPVAVRAAQPGAAMASVTSAVTAQRALVAGRDGAVAVGGADARLSEARVALARGVVTARESRAIAAMYQSLSQVTQAAQASGAMQRVLPMGLASIAPVGADEPVLGRIVQRMNTMRAEQPLTAGRWNVPNDLAERVAKLEGADRTQVQRALQLAGWSEPELKMLDIAKADAGAREVAQPDAVAMEEGVARARPSVAGIAQNARASRMGRSLARVVTGAEALGATVSDKQTGASASSIAQSQAASWLPLLGTGADAKYFGALAPSVASVAAQGSPVREALGALVKMAEAAVASSDSPVALAAHREVLRRASELKDKASVAGDRATLARIMEVAAQAEQMRLVSPDSPTAVVDALGERVTGMLGEGAQIKPFEDGITSAISTAEGLKIGTGYAHLAQREMRVMDAERTMLGLASEPGEAPAGLEARLAKALALSTSGPAGARRMMRSAVAPKVEATKPATTSERRALWNRGPDEAAILKDTVMSGRSPDVQRADLVAQQLGALQEEMSRGVSVMLNSILAPEAMLNGLRSPELSEAIRAVVMRRMQLDGDFTPVLTTLADAGVDLSAARSSLSAQVQVELAKRMKAAAGGAIGGVGVNLDEIAGEKLAFKPIGPEDGQFRVSKSALAGDAAEREWVSLLSESGDVASQLSASSGMSRRARAGMLSSILRGTERAEMTALLEQVGGREFAMAWLNRVDGSRSGIDIGMKGARQEFGQTFGVRRNSAVASDSPIRDVSYVNTAVDGGGAEDRSGLRSIAAEMVHTSTGAARPQHGASQAMRRTDWSFVETGSRASTSHADLGKLAASIVGSAESSSRAPMPLVAPAMKAIAQTALRDPTTSSNVSNNNSSSGGPGPAASGSRGPVDAKMSEKAIEMLAIEMANRVARLMGLTNERRGIWS